MSPATEKPAGRKGKQKRTRKVWRNTQEKMQGLIKMKKRTDKQFDRPYQ